MANDNNSNLIVYVTFGFGCYAIGSVHSLPKSVFGLSKSIDIFVVVFFYWNRLDSHEIFQSIYFPVRILPWT